MFYIIIYNNTFYQAKKTAMKRALDQIQIFNDFVLFVIPSINEQISGFELCYCDTSLTFLVCSEKDIEIEEQQCV